MRTIIVGGPRSGKSTLARELRAKGVPTYCGDPLSKVKEPEAGVTYLDEGLDFDGDNGAAAYIAAMWFPRPGPWCCEGWIMARALRRYIDPSKGYLHSSADPVRPCDRIIVFRGQHQHAVTKPGQRAMGKGVMTVWDSIAHHFATITEYR